MWSVYLPTLVPKLGLEPKISIFREWRPTVSRFRNVGKREFQSLTQWVLVGNCTQTMIFTGSCATFTLQTPYFFKTLIRMISMSSSRESVHQPSVYIMGITHRTLSVISCSLSILISILKSANAERLELPVMGLESIGLPLTDTLI